jgi:hypothetical protein
MYKGKVFVIKASGGVFRRHDRPAWLMEQVAILHQVGVASCSCTAAAAAHARSRSRSGSTPRIVAAGASPTRSRWK